MAQTKKKMRASSFGDFLPEHVEFLSHIDHDILGRFVRPGGSPFDKRFGLLDIAPAHAALRPSRKHLDLKLSVPRERFLPAEPIILDVEFGPRSGVESRYRLPNELDPGHEACQLWIVQPDGERRRYRPVHNFCGMKNLVTVSKTQRMRNNFSLFWGRGGYTFQQAGEYTVYCTYWLDDNRVVRSNDVSFAVVPWSKCTDAEKEQVRLLFHPSVGRACFYRNLVGRRNALKRLGTLAEQFSRHPASVFARYLLGRHELSRGRRNKRSKLRKAARELLKRVSDSGFLGYGCRETALRLLDQDD